MFNGLVGMDAKLAKSISTLASVPAASFETNKCFKKRNIKIEDDHVAQFYRGLHCRLYEYAHLSLSCTRLRTVPWMHFMTS